MNNIILQTIDLKKYFGSVHAVDGVSLDIQRGEVFGFLGPNGAGKTTTIGMVLGLLHPTAGSIRLFEQPLSPAQNAPLRRVGALVGFPSVVPYLSARDNLDLLARLHPGTKQGRINEILAFHTRQPGERISSDTDRDFIMDAAQAREYGIVDQVISRRER